MRRESSARTDATNAANAPRREGTRRAYVPLPLTQSIRRLPAESYLARESHPAHSHSSPRTGGATLRLSGTTARTLSGPAEQGKDAHLMPFLSGVTRASPSTRNTRAKGVPELRQVASATASFLRCAAWSDRRSPAENATNSRRPLAPAPYRRRVTAQSAAAAAGHAAA